MWYNKVNNLICKGVLILISLLSSPAVSESEITGNIIQTVISWCLNTGIKVVISLLIMAIGFRLVNSFARKIQKRLSNNEKFDKTIVKTLTYIGKIAAKTLILICLIGYLGIDTSGLTALVASFGVAAGLAVNGALSNFAGGVIILFTRPFKVDDYIEIEDSVSGTVEDIQIVCTKLRTPDNKVIYVPNGTLSNSNIINYSEKSTRRVDFDFTISYENDFETAKSIIREICEAHSMILRDPEPTIRVSNHADSSIVIATRVWVESENYWTVKFDILEAVKSAFDKNGITIPYNQLDVHVKND